MEEIIKDEEEFIDVVSDDENVYEEIEEEVE